MTDLSAIKKRFAAQHTQGGMTYEIFAERDEILYGRLFVASEDKWMPFCWCAKSGDAGRGYSAKYALKPISEAHALLEELDSIMDNDRSTSQHYEMPHEFLKRIAAYLERQSNLEGRGDE